MKPRAVLDTNVFVSVLLFEGPTKQVVDLWQEGQFIPLISKPILEEYLQVLAYPKFQLTDREIKSLIEDELLPFVEIVSVRDKKVVQLSDRSDEKFLACARDGRSDYLVTGDRVLLALKEFEGTKVVKPSAFLTIALAVERF